MPVTREQLESFAGIADLARLDHSQPASGQVMGQPAKSPSFDMEGFLYTANIQFHPREPYQGGWRWVLHQCPFNPDHDRGESAVFLDREGEPGFNCFHDSCQDFKGWRAFSQELRQRLDEDENAETLEALDAFDQPIGYYNRPSGLFFGSRDKPPLRLGDSLEIVARVRCEDSTGWGVALRWRDPDETEQNLVVSSADLIEDSNSVLARLVDRGYRMGPQKAVKDRLVYYLLNSQAPSAMRADHTGWYGDAYVFPDQVIGQPAERVHYVRSGRIAAEYDMAGSLADWQEQIGRYCPGNSRLVLAVSAAFAGPLLAPTNNESGGVHFRGGSSTGKTTALQVAGSVCGGGGTNGFISQWRATSNGLEGLAVAHNDGLLVLDELGQISGREVADAMYMLSNQAGKARAMKDGGLALTRHWRLIILSSGEVSAAEHAGEAGRRIRGGAEVRLLNVPADAGRGFGLFEDLHGFQSAAALSEHLKESAKALYGTALRAYLRWFCQNRAVALRRVEEIQAEFLRRYKPEGVSGEVGRALRRFGLLAAAGELATHAGVTGWPQGEARKATAVCFDAWLGERGGTDAADIEKGVRQVESFLETQRSRFQGMGAPCAPRDRVGFMTYDRGRAEYLILPYAFRDVVCIGCDHKLIRDALIDRGLMVRGRKNTPVSLNDHFPTWVRGGCTSSSPRIRRSFRICHLSPVLPVLRSASVQNR